MNTQLTEKQRTAKRLRDARYRYAKRIRTTNEAFKAMSPEAKRVQIAKDVIASLDAKRIVPVRGNYLTLPHQYDYAAHTENETYEEGRARVQATDLKDAQTALLSGEVKCEVCAIGSVFLCAVERMDEIALGKFRNADKSTMADYVGDFFSLRQLDLMEVAFEGRADMARSYTDADEDVLERALTFSRAHRSSDILFMSTSESRMRAIMANIIANNGEFKP